MSAICGYICLDGREATHQALELMMQPLAYLNTDSVYTSVRENFAVANLHVQVGKSASFTNPLWSADGNYLVIADARIDAVDELKKRLQVDAHHGDASSLLLAAYRKFGNRCCEFINGDFVFIIWDKTNHKLVAARDRSGCRTLYYKIENETFYFSSNIYSLTVQPGFSCQLNRELAAKDLILPGYAGRTSTYFKGIQKLERAHHLLVESGGQKNVNYWRPDYSQQLHYKDEREYIDHFSELFRGCIRDRMIDGSIGLTLSSGLDSGTIAAVISDELANNPTLNTRLCAVNWTYGPGSDLNESDGSRALAEKYQFDYQEIDITQIGLLNSIADFDIKLCDPYSSHMYPAIISTLMAYSRLPGVWMTGYFGDYLIGGTSLKYYYELAKLKSPMIAWRQFSEHQQQFTNTGLLNFLLNTIKDELLLKFYFPLRYWEHRRRKGKYAFVQHWVVTELITEFPHLSDWIQAQNSRFGWSRYNVDEKEYQHWLLFEYNRPVRTREWLTDIFSRYNAVLWSPWDDSRLVDFVLSVPTSVIHNGLIEKAIVRKAFGKLLPDHVYANPRRWRGYGDNIAETIRRFDSGSVEVLLTNMVSAKLGLVNDKILKNRYNKILNGQQDWRFDLWMPYCVESWVRCNKL